MGIEHIGGIKDRKPNPQKTEGTVDEIPVSDDNVQQLLSDILKELKILNLHAFYATGNEIGGEDVDG